MSLVLYNTFSNKEEPFKPIEPGKVRMYTCGPTVYGRPHIGNYSSFLMADLIRRWLEASGYEVQHVKNITDVGHLTGDDTADASGEDKIEKQAKAEAVDPLDIARRYTEEYLADEEAMNFLEPMARPKASETITEMIAMTETLIEKGHAYETDDGVYFSVESFPEYGQLSGNEVASLSAGARIQVDENKRHPADFALWKKCVGENEHHILRWPSPWGEGFPGWHIECSCMSRKLLGDQIDIHTGGEDLIFPHHECEIAQSECSGESPAVNYWVHKRFINMGDTKMSKSLGNVLTLPDIEASGFSPLDLRYYLLSVHYRTELKFTEKGIDDARKARRKIVEWMVEVETSRRDVSTTDQSTLQYIDAFTAAMNADLNTPGALAVVFDAMAESRKSSSQAAFSDFSAMVEHTFGCFAAEAEESVPAEVQTLLDQRADARANKDFEASDRLRDEIASLGWEVRDGGEGQTVKKL